MKPTIVSFVHGFENLGKPRGDRERPGLVVIDDEGMRTYDYFFPRNPEDFSKVEDFLAGEMPLGGSLNFEKLPRFGLTGLARDSRAIFAGSWNGVYQLNLSDYSIESFISNRLMGDLHGIYADDEVIAWVLTGRDRVVISDHQGNIVEQFVVRPDLTVCYDDEDSGVDWRFVSKQRRGAAGFWHFNYIQKVGNDWYLTSRNANCLLRVESGDSNARLITMNWCTPILIHDGAFVDGAYFFTSIDGKILRASPHEKRKSDSDDSDSEDLFTHGLNAAVFRLEECGLGREPNWCRGISISDNAVYVTIDGRYDTELSFGILKLDRATMNVTAQWRLDWSNVGEKDELRYVTGFDIL